MDVSRHILVIDISVLAKSNMGRREYQLFKLSNFKKSIKKKKRRVVIIGIDNGSLGLRQFSMKGKTISFLYITFNLGACLHL
jgi:hypothetical protein